ncbi:alpha/beta hydrolase [Rhizobium mongolense]|uniref:alpha/beta hydrolase n=1 Tax=Rhizobium mongolense TaxID=57676 RepID=UPI0035E4212A
MSSSTGSTIISRTRSSVSQIVHDSGAHSVPVLATWPSRGSLLAYGYDRESTNYTRNAVENLFQYLARDPQVKEVSILARWATEREPVVPVVYDEVCAVSRVRRDSSGRYPEEHDARVIVDSTLTKSMLCRPGPQREAVLPAKSRPAAASWLGPVSI